MAALVGDGVGQPVFPAGIQATDQTWRVQELACAGGRVVLLAGGGLLGRQYAAYAWLHRLGIRFFHPEQTYVPPAPDWPDPLWDQTLTPAFERRSVTLHLTHPLELGDPIRAGRLAYQEEVRRYIDWGIRNFASDGLGGLDGTELQDYGIRRGFPRTGGFSLYNQQQGATGILDPDDPRGDEAQLADAIDARMADPERRPQIFSFTFNPSEFTEEDDRTVVRQLSFIADYFREKYPDTRLFATNHGTAGPPTPHYGVRYYDLPQFAPENLGVKVHTLMFYDLERPAPVYGNADFHFLYEFMEREHTKREIEYFPEAAWWLTFDIAVPLYLPITIEARSRDLKLIAPMLDGKLTGHRVFGTGHEWGYWQNEYCSYRMAADLDYDWHACLADITTPLGPAAAEVQAILRPRSGSRSPSSPRPRCWPTWWAPIPRRRRRRRSGSSSTAALPGRHRAVGCRAYLPVATRDSCPAARQPRRPPRPHRSPRGRRREGPGDRPSVVWRDRRRHRGQHTPRLTHQIARTTPSSRAERPPDGRRRHPRPRPGRPRSRPGDHRARPGGHRPARAGLPLPPAGAIHRRRTDAGCPDANWTIYPYRYLGRTHLAWYYRRLDELALEAFAGSEADVEVHDAVLAPGEP
ncbi:MAG: hypothetical protein R3F43_17090 [bacterium]